MNINTFSAFGLPNLSGLGNSSSVAESQFTSESFNPFEPSYHAPRSSSGSGQMGQMMMMLMMTLLLKLISKIQHQQNQTIEFVDETEEITEEETEEIIDETENTGNGGNAGNSGNGGNAGNSGGIATGTQGITADDIVNYFKGTSKGGTEDESESVSSLFSDPNSRFHLTGDDQFDAAIAKIYANQFKAGSLGLDSFYNKGDDMNKLAQNVLQAMNTPFNEEAELLAQVAAIYRGELPGSVGRYNHPALKGLLEKWGRADLANQPFVGTEKSDVETISNVIKALQQEADKTKRQAMLQDIFDFKNNTANSPSGAVPDLVQYQKAIDLLRNGTFARLLDEYNKGIKTNVI